MLLFSEAYLCQSDWKYYDERCYILVKRNVSYNTAQADCKDKKAILATIGNEGENNFLTKL